MVNKVFVLLFCVTLIMACVKSNNESSSLDNKITVDITNLPELPSSAIDTILYVPLETTNDALIGGNPILRFSDSDIYVTSMRSEKIIKFDKNGKVQLVMEHKGQSGEEYMKLSDFFVTKDGIFVYDGLRNYLLQYDNKTGIYKNKIKFEANNAEYILPYKDQFLLFDSNPPDGKMALQVLDKTGKKINEFLENKGYSLGHLFIIDGPISEYDNEVYITCTFDNNIYVYDGNKCQPKYQFDFGKNNIPSTFVENNKRNSKIFEELNSLDNRVYGFQCLVIQGDWMYMALKRTGMAKKICINTKTKQIYQADKSVNYSLTYSCLICVKNQDYFVSTIPAQNIMSLKEHPEKGLYKCNNPLLDLKIDEDSNPVVCFIKLKDNFK